jgi:hypothetical protein
MCNNATCSWNASNSSWKSNVTVQGGNSSSFGSCVVKSSSHPCAQAKDATACLAQKDAAGRAMCYSQVSC